MRIDLSNKVIVITGGAGDLGSAMALQFARAGACVAINYHRNEKVAKNLLSRISEFSERCCIVYADVTNNDDVYAMYKIVMKKYGRVDVLINNAGRNNDGYTTLMSEKQWSSVITTNLTGTFLCSRVFSKAMIRDKRGKIINIASLKGQLGSEGQANYAASKAGIIGFSKSLAKELGPEGVSVNVVCPGYIKTNLNSGSIKKREIAENMSAMSVEYSKKDFENFMLFLASDMIKGVSGQVYNIDSRIM